MEENFRRYPIGIQNFEDLRNNDCVYVDKTELIYRLTHTNKVYFLSRPRRWEKKNCFKAWLWRLWKRIGRSTRYYTLILV